MKFASHNRFQGNPSLRPKTAHADSPQEPEPYILEEGLKQAVNLAIALRRPLLLEGEAGCGKTKLARAVAYELGLPFYRWDIRSTTKVKDGLYNYDSILRLHDVQLQKANTKLTRDPSDPKQYCKLGKLGQAFNLKDCRAVVLIDEIDKADLDFPNDLLTVLDEPWSFPIPETEDTITATPGNEPIIIITSNKEKGNLPYPFLRRCLYYFMNFPSEPQRLQDIVTAHYQNAPDHPLPANDLVEVAAEKFLAIRKSGELFKNPGTSEFLDWIAALHSFDSKPYTAAKLRNTKAIPFPEVLFKLRADWQRYTAV